MNNNDKNDILPFKFEFAPLIVIPMVSLMLSIFKIFGLTDKDWIDVLLSYPLIGYFIYNVSFFIIAALMYLIAKGQQEMK